MTEKLYTKAQVYAMALPSTYLQPLNLPLDTDVPALMKLYAKLKATQQLPSTTPVSSDPAGEKEFYDRAVAKLFTSTPAEEAEWERKRQLIARLALNGGASDSELALLKQWELLPGEYDDSVSRSL